MLAVMHTKLHYAVMEITVDTKTIKIFDGLRLDLLEWKDHVIRVMRIASWLIQMWTVLLHFFIRIMLSPKLWVAVGTPGNM